MVSSTRAGRFIQQPMGYRAFIPAPLPPDPPIAYSPALVGLLSRADQLLGRLDGGARRVPDPDLFVALYVRREAVLSSQIEGTQSTLEDVLAYELDGDSVRLPSDIVEVVNYVRAMNYGLARLATLPLSLRLIREIHAELLDGVRGADKQPGEFRSNQNWIGAGGAPLMRATFVPPPPAEMLQALSDLEVFLHEGELPTLLLCGLAHAQFETIHPFLDGNGRVGRLLITFLLCQKDVLRLPLLYLSLYFKQNRSEYYDRLMAVRERGDWEGWLTFFLNGVVETATEAVETAFAIDDLRERSRKLINERGGSRYGQRLLDLLLRRPMVNAKLVGEELSAAKMTVTTLLSRFVDLGLLEEITGARRDRVYRFSRYLALFDSTAGEGNEPSREEFQVTGHGDDSA